MQDEPSLGIVDMGESDLVQILGESKGLETSIYDSESNLLQDLEINKIDAGVVLSQGFDSALARGEAPEMTVSFSGKSYASHRIMIQNTISKHIREMAGQEIPVEFNLTVLGTEQSLTMGDRITPFIFLAVIMVSGYFLTSLGIVEEREEGTVRALSVAPVSKTDFVSSKAILGYLMAIAATTLTFFLNGITSPGYLVLLMPFLLLGGGFAVFLGIIFGAFTDNSTELFGTAKGVNLLLFAPALVILFPSLPQWIAKFFPTYYIIYPILEISMMGAKWGDVWQDFIILAVIVLVTGIISLVYVSRKTKEF